MQRTWKSAQITALRDRPCLDMCHSLYPHLCASRHRHTVVPPSHISHPVFAVHEVMLPHFEPKCLLKPPDQATSVESSENHVPNHHCGHKYFQGPRYTDRKSTRLNSSHTVIS